MLLFIKEKAGNVASIILSILLFVAVLKHNWFICCPERNTVGARRGSSVHCH